MKVTFNKQEFTLEYNNQALFDIEKILDKPFLTVVLDPNEKAKLNTQFAVVYAGIQGDKMTFYEFTAWVDIEEVANQILDVYSFMDASFDTGKDVKKKKKVAEKV